MIGVQVIADLFFGEMISGHDFLTGIVVRIQSFASCLHAINMSFRVVCNAIPVYSRYFVTTRKCHNSLMGHIVFLHNLLGVVVEVRI